VIVIVLYLKFTEISLFGKHNWSLHTHF